MIRDEASSDCRKFEKGDDAWMGSGLRLQNGPRNEESRNAEDARIIEEFPDELDIKKVRAMDPPMAEKMNLAQGSTELFQVLILQTDGEAKLIVKSVADQDFTGTTTGRRSRRPSGITARFCIRGP